MKVESAKQKAGIYVRISRLRDDENTLSAETQRATCHALAVARGLIVEVTEEDLDESAYNQPWKKRPGFRRLVESVVAGEIQAIIVSRIDRFARRTKDALEVVEHLQQAGGRLIAGDCEVDIESATGKFSLQFMSSLAELESGRISERVAAAAHTRALKGKGHVGTPPMWLKYNKSTQEHVIREEVAVAFRLIVSMRAAGRGYTSITRALNSQGLTKSSGAPWKVADVQRYLADHWLETMGTGVQFHHRPTYRKTKDGKPIKKLNTIRIEGVYPPIVDSSIAFEAIAVNKRNRQPGTRNTGDAYLLQGILFCEQCGGLMKGHTVSHGRYYRCEALGHRSHKGRTHISAALADDAVLRVMKQYVLRMSNAIKRRAPAKPSPLNLERQLRNLDGQIDRLNKSFRIGFIAEDKYIKEMTELRLDRVSLVDSATQTQTDLPPIPADTTSVPTSTLRNILRRYHVRAEYPLWDERITSQNGSLRPLVRISFQPEGHFRAGHPIFEFYSPVYRATWQGLRQVFAADELYGVD